MRLITDPANLRPDTSWARTKWARVGEESLVDHTTRPRLCVAALLPSFAGRNRMRWRLAFLLFPITRYLV